MATRVVLGALALGGCLLLPACTDVKAGGESGEDLLLIELGGDNPPLRESLRALGVLSEPEPKPEPRRPDPGGHGPGNPEDRPPQPDPRPPRPEPQPRQSGPEFFTVELKEGETLWDLAQEHLGKGTRCNEILALNGWTESRARRLRAGTTVRIPRE